MKWSVATMLCLSVVSSIAQAASSPSVLTPTDLVLLKANSKTPAEAKALREKLEIKNREVNDLHALLTRENLDKAYARDQVETKLRLSAGIADPLVRTATQSTLKKILTDLDAGNNTKIENRLSKISARLEAAIEKLGVTSN